MRSQKNEQQVPQITISAAGKNYQVDLVELTEFLDRHRVEHGPSLLQDIDYVLEDIADLVVNGATTEDNSVSGMKRTYNFVKNLRFLFKTMLYETKS